MRYITPLTNFGGVRCWLLVGLAGVNELSEVIVRVCSVAKTSDSTWRPQIRKSGRKNAFAAVCTDSIKSNLDLPIRSPCHLAHRATSRTVPPRARSPTPKSIVQMRLQRA